MALGAVLLLAGCAGANTFVKQDVANIRAPMDSTARQLYSVAKSCWQKEETLVYAEVMVDNVVTLDGVLISARAGTLNPFIKFLVSDTDGQTTVQMYTRELGWPGRDKHLADAKRWLNGDYVCEPLAVYNHGGDQ